MTLAAIILLSSLPQGYPGGDLKLPPRKAVVVKVEQAGPVKELERFRRDLLEMSGPSVKVDAKLAEMGLAYPKIEDLILQIARSARASEMRNLMPVARRYGRVSGKSRVADELLFQLLSRPLGAASHAVIATMAMLKGNDAKPALKQCMRARAPAVRRQAVSVLGSLCTQDDVPFAVALTRERSLDLRLRGVDLLTVIGGDVASSRLVELLSKDPALAASACIALVRMGTSTVPTLHDRVMGPVIDRSYVYAAFALAQIGAATGDDVLPAELLEPLSKQLQSPEALTRVLSAVPLADLVYRAAPGEGRELPDAGLVEALLLVVEPKQFVPNLDMLRAPAESRLLRHTGRVLVGGKNLSWRSWWQGRKGSFSGVRSQLVIDEDNVRSAIVTLRHAGRVVRFLAEDVVHFPPLSNATEVMLTGEQMLTLVRSLQSDGYGDALRMRVDSTLPRVRSLEIVVAEGRSSVAVTETPHVAFDNMVATIDACVAEELWQLYRVADLDPDREKFWRREQSWRAEHPNAVGRARRVLGRVVRGWSDWDVQMKVRAIGFIAGDPGRKEVLGVAQGEAIVAALTAQSQLAEQDLQLLELASTVPGDKVWRDCVALAVSVEGGGRDAVAQVFKVLGPDAVLSALKDDRSIVRRAAVDEVVAVRDARASPTLIRLLQDVDFDVQRAAASACGHLKITAASRPLVDIIAEAETDPVLRRECMRALGRAGGPLAFPVLQQALASPIKADKEAALRGLGELRDPRAAHLLAEFVVLGYGKDIGSLAKFHLQRQGATMAVPALESQIRLVQDTKIRADLVLLMGLYQARQNVPDLMDLLRQREYAGEAVTYLEGATGLDLTSVSDRIMAVESWWRINKNLDQSQWLLEALRRAEVPHKLTLDNFSGSSGMSAVPELARLMVEVEKPRLWVLCSAVLRSVAKQDFGVVTMQTPPDVREGMAGRYLVLAEVADTTGK